MNFEIKTFIVTKYCELRTSHRSDRQCYLEVKTSVYDRYNINIVINTIRKYVKSWQEGGSVTRRYHRTIQETEAQRAQRERIVNYFDFNPSASLRKAKSELGISMTTIHRTLKKEKLKAYKVFEVQKLKRTAKIKRFVFCQRLASCIDPMDIWFSDEKLFCINGRKTTKTLDDGPKRETHS